MLITWLSDVMRQEQARFTPVLQEGVTPSRIISPVSRPQYRQTFISMVTIGAAVTLCHFALPAWSADLSASASQKPRKTVAAGLGYQDADTSSITVKTYDADSGEVLSTETYELDIKEDGPPSSRPRARIFAGGVGVGSDGLSEFTLRVYDATSGRFLWEGRLNLSSSSSPDVAAYPVVAQVRPRVAVTKVFGRIKANGQPYFVLRAVNSETGQLIWGDEFSANAASVRVERISRSIIGMAGGAPPEIDFRIKMPDEAGRHLLWEDKVVPTVDDEAVVPERSEDPAGILPVWPHGQGDNARD